jgi:flavin reductase (DIM6/NTAB) family NADH-FMN oxidoreductase RutF
MRKDLGARAFGFGWPVPVLMVATYNDDGSVNVMNLHEAMRTNAGDLALCIGPRSKTHENVEKRGAFTVALVNREMMAEIDYLGTVTGRRVPDKFERTGLKAVRSAHVDAPILAGSPLVVECELKELVRTENFSTVIGTIVDVAADESVLGETGRADAEKLGMVLYDSFSNSYFTLGEKVGKAWGEGKKYLK